MSPDALEYTFKLRSGVKFHNGKTVAAEDGASKAVKGYRIFFLRRFWNVSK